METKTLKSGYSFGLLQVDTVMRAETGKITRDPTAPWIRKLKAPFKTQMPQCTLFCSNTAVNFDQIRVMDTYGTHLFLWRQTKKENGILHDKYFLRVFSGDMMEALITAAKKNGKAQKQNPSSDNDVEEVLLSITKIETKPQKASAIIDVTDILAPYADACACDDLAAVRQTVKNVVDRLNAEVTALAAQQKEEAGE